MPEVGGTHVFTVSLFLIHLSVSSVIFSVCGTFFKIVSFVVFIKEIKENMSRISLGDKVSSYLFARPTVNQSFD